MTDLVAFEAIAETEKRAVYWGFLWRGLLVTLGSTLSGAVIGGILGLIIGEGGDLLGISAKNTLIAIRIISLVAGLIVGLWFLVLYVRWLFRGQFGPFRLGLVRASGAAAA